jgi:hypothetical protein
MQYGKHGSIELRKGIGMADEQEPLIHIDEDWKSQVEKEREALHDAEETVIEGEEQQPELTLFEYHVSGIAANCTIALGLVGQEGEQVMVDIPMARQMIDTLLMLKEKTQGNITEGEAANLEEAITELERVFIIREQQVSEMQMNQPPDSTPPELIQ